MTALLRVYPRLLRAEWLISTAYRAEMLIWGFGALAQPLVSMAVWMSVSASAPVGRYGPGDFLRYFVVVMFVERLTRDWHVWELERDIREGYLNFKLVQPVHPVHRGICANLAGKLFFLLLLLPVWALLWWWFPEVRFPLRPARVVMFALTLLLGAAIRFTVSWGCGVLSFWTTRAASIYLFIESAGLFLGGRVAPLDLFPPTVADLAAVLPWRFMVALPADVLLGRIDSAQVAAGLAWQVAWLLAFATGVRRLWRAGLRRYGAVGG